VSCPSVPAGGAIPHWQAKEGSYSMTDHEPGIYGGVDTHLHTHVAAVVDQTGRILGAESLAPNH